MSKHPLIALLEQGHAAQRVAHAAGEAGKLGHFRGGNVGVVAKDGAVYGKCQRLSYLRSIGLEQEIEENRFDMFAAGLANEDIVVKLLRDGDPNLTVRHGETGLELSYKLADGTTVSSRPDLVLEREGKVVAGVETKMVASIWTAIGVHYDLKPKSDHLIQAAHYALQLGKPTFWLLYSSRTEWHVSTAPKFLQDKFGPGTYDVEFRKDGKPLKVVPFNRVYDLAWTDDGFLTYHTDGLDEPIKTLIDADGIRRYYETVAAVRDHGDLGPRPSTKSVDGGKGYSPCDYCDLAEICDAYEGAEFSTWRDHVTAKLGGSK